MNITTDLPPLTIPVPKSLRDLLRHSSASKAGFSAVSGFLACPEKARLQAMGLKPVGERVDDDIDYLRELNALEYGTLIHFLRAVRFIWGQQAMMDLLAAMGGELLPSDFEAASMMLRTYDSLWPRENDPFQLLGVECEVISDVGFGELRTVRYDTVIRYQSGEIFSFEAKTSARSGASALSPYFPQGMSQTAIWNANPHLVAKYGEMRGSLFEQFVKTNTPKIDRVGPYYWTKRHQLLARNYLVAPGRTVQFFPEPEGNAPRQLHACWGRYRPCEYMGLCHEEEWGNYVFTDGRPYNGE